MRSLSREQLRAGTVVAALVLVTIPAVADVTKGECVRANASGQNLRREGKFSDARAALRVCNDPLCPTLVGEDCTKRLDELEAAQPTIIFDAKDGSGHDRSAVLVTMDGHPFADKLDGTPLQVDRGEHEFTFTMPGQEPVTEKLVIKESEKARHYRVVIGAVHVTEAAGPARDEPPQPAHTAMSPRRGTRKWIGLALGGAGVGGVVVGSVFGVLTAAAIKRQKADCGSSGQCPHPGQAASDHTTWTTDSTVSTVAFIAGGALIAGGLTLFLTAPRGTERPVGMLVTPSAGPGGGALLLRGEF